MAHSCPRTLGEEGGWIWRRAVGKRGRRRPREREACNFTGISALWQQECSPCFWPSASRTAPLAPCLTAYLSSVLHSVSICCWLPTCCLGNPRILCADYGGVALPQLCDPREAGSWVGGQPMGARGWSGVSCRARRTLRGGAAGFPRELPGDVVYEVSVTPR